MFATHSDLGEHDWGEVTVWEPGRRLVHSFTLAQDPKQPSEVAVESDLRYLMTRFVVDTAAVLHLASGGSRSQTSTSSLHRRSCVPKR